jgi:prolipoprotein diacylglyceryltransferase
MNSSRVAGPAGYRFLYFVALIAGARLFLEAFRGDSVLIGPGIRSVQVAAWAVLAAGLVGLWGIIRRSRGSFDRSS